MKLEKFSKNKKQKRMFVGIVTFLVLLVGGVILYTSFAFYEEKKEYNILKGMIPSHWYSMKTLSIVVDGEEKDQIPDRGLYKTNVTCTNGSSGEWDYNAWTLNVSELKDNTQCNVEFLSNALTNEEYNTYINAGKALRRNTYRGKDITSYFNDGSAYDMISKGTFDDIYVGDVMTLNGIKWIVADIDNYLYSGDKSLAKHHITVIPYEPIGQARMNSTNTAEGGYLGSEMVTTTLPQILNEKIIPAFGDEHVLTYRNSLVSTVDINVASSGYGNWKGASYEGEWKDRRIDLMSEVNVFGAPIWSSSGYDTGIDNRQYALFQLRPEMISNNGTGPMWYWLKNVANNGAFSSVNGEGAASFSWAEALLGVRPRFLIG